MRSMHQSYQKTEQLNAILKGKSGIPATKRYFHILGIDIMLNEMMDPIVLELNDRPSMHVTFDIEAELKPRMIHDALTLITTDGNPPDPANISKNWEKILPLENDTPFGTAVNEILSKSKKDFNPRMSLFLNSRTTRSAIKVSQKLPPLKPLAQ